jgi:exopolysaccharide biosynthesis polyprenyl glycosylphosphotransferase
MTDTFQPPNQPVSIRSAAGRPRTALGRRRALPEAAFVDALRQERRRSERSGKPFVLMLARPHENLNGTTSRLLTTLSDSVRETDTIGWYQQDEILGVIFTELGDAEKNAVLSSLNQRAINIVRNGQPDLKTLAVTFTFHFFPDESQPNGHSMDLSLYPELSRENGSKKLARVIKRVMDVLGSVVALALLSGLFLAIALLIKLTSKGPVLFRQVRVGHGGKAFCFLKFRSMYVNNDATLHQEYVSRFIAGQAERHTVNGKEGVYKITNDPRVTALGRFLRKTSLDELPQLINVIRGEMSLIGPRPPVPYEFQRYGLWHRRRVLEIKPGITGLWQVNGRSRTSFDDMVRLDLQYARQWSLWLDLKILLQTPKAVLFGNGAY